MAGRTVTRLALTAQNFPATLPWSATTQETAALTSLPQGTGSSRTAMAVIAVAKVLQSPVVSRLVLRLGRRLQQAHRSSTRQAVRASLQLYCRQQLAL